MADKLMYITNVDTYTKLYYNKWMIRLDTQLNEPIYQNSIKVLKVVELSQRNQIESVIIKLWGLV